MQNDSYGYFEGNYMWLLTSDRSSRRLPAIWFVICDHFTSRSVQAWIVLLSSWQQMAAPFSVDGKCDLATMGNQWVTWQDRLLIMTSLIMRLLLTGATVLLGNKHKMYDVIMTTSRSSPMSAHRHRKLCWCENPTQYGESMRRDRKPYTYTSVSTSRKCPDFKC